MPLSVKKIRSIVGEILQKINYHDKQLKLREVLDLFNLKLTFIDDNEDTSGNLFKSDDAYFIGVSREEYNRSPQRARFTIAHEIGHYVCHFHEKYYVHTPNKALLANRDEISSLAIDQKEIEANTFAAELLMPYENVWNIMDNRPIGDELIEEIKNEFDVSFTAASFRIQNILKEKGVRYVSEFG